MLVIRLRIFRIMKARDPEVTLLAICTVLTFSLSHGIEG
jgi:hypothetical protein